MRVLIFVMCCPHFMHAPFLHTQELFFIIVTNSQAFLGGKKYWEERRCKLDKIHCCTPQQWITITTICEAKLVFFFFFSQTLNQYSIVFLTVNLTCPVFFLSSAPTKHGSYKLSCKGLEFKQPSWNVLNGCWGPWKVLDFFQRKSWSILEIYNFAC